MSAAPSPFVRSIQTAFEHLPHRVPTQQRALSAFLAMGLPSPKLDIWKYTDLRRFAMRSFELASGGELTSELEARLINLADSDRIVFVDGKLAASPASSDVATIKSQPVTQPFDERPENAFGMLNAALTQEEWNINIKEAPTSSLIYVVFAWSAGAKELMHHPRITINLQRHARATIVEHHVGLHASTSLLNSTLNVHVQTNAHLEHVRIQDDGRAAFNIAAVNAVVEKDANYTRHDYAFGANLSRSDIAVDLSGDNAQTELHGLIFATDTQHLDTHTCVHHRVANTRSKEDYRGIADRRGRVVFNGKVIVDKDAQRIDAMQSSRNLLLSPLAEIDTRPELEIYANDVKCAHGATVGQLDATALFYLQSRGVSREDARTLLTHAFAAEVIERISQPVVREFVLTRFMERMRSGASS